MCVSNNSVLGCIFSIKSPLTSVLKWITKHEASFLSSCCPSLMHDTQFVHLLKLSRALSHAWSSKQSGPFNVCCIIFCSLDKQSIKTHWNKVSAVLRFALLWSGLQARRPVNLFSLFRKNHYYNNKGPWLVCRPFMDIVLEANNGEIGIPRRILALCFCVAIRVQDQ